mmetsp:Transcript_11872/g.17809  ORF Transcript_11872/g.17809 Transcript_11872/m.17809 type:complete len:213 (+) Transcript_11872:195-833(+)
MIALMALIHVKHCDFSVGQYRIADKATTTIICIPFSNAEATAPIFLSRVKNAPECTASITTSAQNPKAAFCHGILSSSAVFSSLLKPYIDIPIVTHIAMNTVSKEPRQQDHTSPVTDDACASFLFLSSSSKCTGAIPPMHDVDTSSYWCRLLMDISDKTNMSEWSKLPNSTMTDPTIIRYDAFFSSSVASILDPVPTTSFSPRVPCSLDDAN